MSDAARKPKAVVLFSGGLDSCLAAELLRRAGVDVVLLCVESVFFPPRDDGWEHGLPVVRRDITDGMIRLLRDPPHGFGRNANPCLDCKMMMYAIACEEADRIGADFVATGEVVGQRPMSQRRDAFRMMEKRSGLLGRIVRPLSGALLRPTLAEQEGLIRREELLDLAGRGRTPQMELAEGWGIDTYPQPAGGCRLTEPQYGKRVLAMREMGLLRRDRLRAVRYGRMIELTDRAFVLVGRSQGDNDGLLRAAPEDALMLELDGRPGPLACLIGEPDDDALLRARRAVVRYSRFRDLPPGEVRVLPTAQMREERKARERA